MKNFFKKINKSPEVEQDDLNLDYGDFYSGKDGRSEDRLTDRGEDRRGEERADDRSAGGYYDVQKTTRSAYDEPDFRSDNTRYYDAERPVERPMERPVERPLDRGESIVNPRETAEEA